jgi:hypothetical protein
MLLPRSIQQDNQQDKAGKGKHCVVQVLYSYNCGMLNALCSMFAALQILPVRPSLIERLD